MIINIKVLIIDDHDVVRNGCRRLFEKEGHVVVGEASSGEQGLEMFRELNPDVVTLDLSLPGMSGLETAQQILSRDSKARIVIFSVQNNVALVERAVQLGVLGYVTKASDSNILAAAVVAVANHKEYLGPDIAQALALKGIHQQNSSFANLTTREFEVFQLAAKGKNSTAISEMLHLSPKTVANHMYRIKQKLDVTTSAEMAHLAIKHDLLME